MRHLNTIISNYESNLVEEKNVILSNAQVVQLIKQEARSRENINNSFGELTIQLPDVNPGG